LAKRCIKCSANIPELNKLGEVTMVYLSDHDVSREVNEIVKARRLRLGEMSLFALLNVISHSVAVAGIARVSKAYWESVGYSLRDAFHLETKSKPLISEISRGESLISTSAEAMIIRESMGVVR
jgi:hypothetical protein